MRRLSTGPGKAMRGAKGLNRLKPVRAEKGHVADEEMKASPAVSAATTQRSNSLPPTPCLRQGRLHRDGTKEQPLCATDFNRPLANGADQFPRSKSAEGERRDHPVALTHPFRHLGVTAWAKGARHQRHHRRRILGPFPQQGAPKRPGSPPRISPASGARTRSRAWPSAKDAGPRRQSFSHTAAAHHDCERPRLPPWFAAP